MQQTRALSTKSRLRITLLSMLRISNNVAIPDTEIRMHAIRAQGAGGQHVNKNATAIHLRFDIQQSTLPDSYKEKLLAMRDHRITDEGVIIIKADGSRSQTANREAALSRLQQLVRQAGVTEKKRRPTRPSRRAKARRADRKTKRGHVKSLRKPPRPE